MRTALIKCARMYYYLAMDGDETSALKRINDRSLQHRHLGVGLSVREAFLVPNKLG